jgi:Ecdysteroid kinase-like family
VGDHFASVMFRIEATVSFGDSPNDQHVMSLILKTAPFVEGVKMDFLKGSPLFEVETKMYSKILPAMEPLLAKCGITPFWPKLVSYTLKFFPFNTYIV